MATDEVILCNVHVLPWIVRMVKKEKFKYTITKKTVSRLSTFQKGYPVAFSYVKCAYGIKGEDMPPQTNSMHQELTNRAETTGHSTARGDTALSLIETGETGST